MAITLKNCCFCVNLRLGTIIIGLICAVIEFISLIINFATIWYVPELEHDAGYIYFLRFTLFFHLVSSCLKLALCMTLYVGLLERRPDHLEIWYKGYMVIEVMYTAYIIFQAFKTAEMGSFLIWLILVGKLLLILVTFYFILVVRSYHHQMCRQPNFYQDFSCQQTSKTYCEKPKDANGEIVLFSAQVPTKEKGGLTPSFIQEGGGMVYATPASSQINTIPVMPSFLLNNDRRPSVDLNALERGSQRRSSFSKPTKKNLKVGFENQIEINE